MKIKDTSAKLAGIFHLSKKSNNSDDFRNLLINSICMNFYDQIHTKILTKTLISEEEAKKESK